MAAGQAWGNRLRCVLSAAAMAAGAFWMIQPTTVPASDPGPVVRVEEDWKLEIIEPAYDETSPQIINTFSACSHLDCHFGLFEVNYSTQPDYRDGGLSVQIWDHDERVNYRRPDNNNRLSYANEVITYTLGMTLNKNSNGNGDGNGNGNLATLQLEVKSGNSQTWGTFGDAENLRCSITTDLDDLTEYSPEFSVANSKVNFASFRVKKLALLQVRKYDKDGTLLSTDSTERIAHQYNGDVDVSE